MVSRSLTFAPSAQDDVSLSFYGLPADPIYTLGMDVSQTWLVRPRESPYDLDNIHLATIPEDERAKGVTAVFDLDFLVIEGHARESTTAPPRGVQLQLTNINSTVPIADTLVMANVGYLQFRAKPGVFQLSIRPGRGREVYDMESVGNEGWNSPTVHEAGDVVTLTSFEGLTLYPRLKRKAGMEQAEVLEESSGGIKESVIAPVLSWYALLPSLLVAYLTMSCSTGSNRTSLAERPRRYPPMFRPRSTSSQSRPAFFTRYADPSLVELQPTKKSILL